MGVMQVSVVTMDFGRMKRNEEETEKDAIIVKKSVIMQMGSKKCKEKFGLMLSNSDNSSSRSRSSAILLGRGLET